MNILDEIAEKTRRRIEMEKGSLMAEELIANARKKVKGQEHHRFYKSLKREGMSFICEIKKASPSKGVIAKDFPYLEIAKDYESAGASAISCLTEPEYFLGSNEILEEVAKAVQLPILKKDFTIDPYMIYQAAYYGASAILLICKILSDEELKSFRELAEDLGLDALVEAHDEEEIERALKSGARIIGVNNRNLEDFSVNTQNAMNLRTRVPEDVIFVSESGIKTRDDVERMEKVGVDAVLIGETLMRSTDKEAKLRELAGKV
ncbi:MAG: indole-3-glycerol phosphate synthase TrpC [Lachnospiraceae bacterium]|nr:indole-3-glycerol phosphate synthase TrpC [Lachnospiraceae bacterium]